MIVFWDENTPATILEQAFLDQMMVAAAGTRIVLAIQPLHAQAFARNTAARIAAFADYVGQIALRYPQVQEYVIGNEPNVKRFFQPQHNPDGTINSAVVYEQILAASYDTLKAIDPRIKVDGLAISPRGNDMGAGTGAESVSPVRFIAALGAAYRQSGRTTPIADVVDVHAYSNINTQPLTRPYQWPQAGAADLDRIKQAWWDAFNGTAQPLFQETGDPTGPNRTYVSFRIDESGTQVKIDPSKVNPSLYSGRENVPTVDEATQARYYTDLINLIKCDPTVATLDLFHLIDEPLLNGFQSGLLRVDDSRRPSYAAVKKAIAAAGDVREAAPVAPHGDRDRRPQRLEPEAEAGRAADVLVEGRRGRGGHGPDRHLRGQRRRADRRHAPELTGRRVVDLADAARRAREGQQRAQLQAQPAAARAGALRVRGAPARDDEPGAHEAAGQQAVHDPLTSSTAAPRTSPARSRSSDVVRLARAGRPPPRSGRAPAARAP